MPARHLSAALRLEHGLPILELQGELDDFGEATLNAAFQNAESLDPPAILLDLSRVGYINSKGIALIVVLLARTRRAGRQMLAWGLSEHYQEILAITRLSEYIAIHADEQSALATLLAPAQAGA